MIYNGPVKSVSVTLAVGNNQTVIAAVTGKRVRVMGYKTQSTTGVQGAYVLKDGSGGTTLDGGFAPPLAGLPFLIPVQEEGYFETTDGVGLFADVVTGPITIQVFYKEYVP